MPAVLLISSTRGFVDPQETLRLKDTADALLAHGWAVDVLVPRLSPLLTVVLPSSVRVFTVPKVPYSDNPPRGPSFRRLVAGFLMFLRGVALASRRDYAVLHGFNDGALVARLVDRGILRRLPYIAELHKPYTWRGMYHGMAAAISQYFERSALRHAAAIILPDNDTLVALEPQPNAPGRVSILPDPHIEIAPDALTLAEFNEAIEKIYYYVRTVPRNEKKN